MSLQGQIALVTGASQGIGAACAFALAEVGADAALGSRNLEKLESVAKTIEGAGKKALAIRMDVSSLESVNAAVAKVLEWGGKIDILVNNAGVTKDNLVMRMKPEDWEAVLKTNLDGAFYCIRAVLPGMVRQRHGRIINVASVVAETGNSGQANYVASKAGLIGLTKSVAAVVARRNITVNRARLHRHCHDGAAFRGGQGKNIGPDSPRPHGYGPRGSIGRALPGLGGGRIHHRSRTPNQRRDVHGLSGPAAAGRAARPRARGRSWPGLSQATGRC